MITSIQDWQNKTANEILEIMISNVGVPINTPVTMAMIKENLNDQHYAEFRLSLIAAKSLITSDVPEYKILAEDISDTQMALAGAGFILHTPERQLLLDQMASVLGWSQELLSSLKQISVKLVPYWRYNGLNSEPTIEDIEKEKIIEMCRLNILEQLNKLSAKSSAINAWLDVLDSNTMTVSEVQTYCESLLASEEGNI